MVSPAMSQPIHIYKVCIDLVRQSRCLHIIYPTRNQQIILTTILEITSFFLPKLMFKKGVNSQIHLFPMYYSLLKKFNFNFSYLFYALFIVNNEKITFLQYSRLRFDHSYIKEC